jgi:2',3'-cyclic-nucleotide 2'-phosphodiesterase (5'-nucleotidase family)
MVAYTHADIAFISWSVLRSTINAGPIHFGDIYRALPYNEEMVIYRLKGSHVLSLLSLVARKKKNSESLLLPSSGLTFKIRNKAPTEILFKGKSLDPDRDYSVVISHYIAQGGDGYRFFTGIKNRKDTGILITKALDSYIRQKERISPDMTLRIQFEDKK